MTESSGRVRSWLAMRLHTIVGRLDSDLDFRNAASLSVALERGVGWVLRQDGTGVPVWFREPEYARADEPARKIAPARTPSDNAPSQPGGPA